MAVIHIWKLEFRAFAFASLQIKLDFGKTFYFLTGTDHIDNKNNQFNSPILAILVNSPNRIRNISVDFIVLTSRDLFTIAMTTQDINILHWTKTRSGDNAETKQPLLSSWTRILKYVIV